MIDCIQIAKRCKELREKTGYGQAAAARKMNIAASTLSCIERSERLPTTAQLLSMAQFYGVTTDYLLGRE